MRIALRENLADLDQQLQRPAECGSVGELPTIRAITARVSGLEAIQHHFDRLHALLDPRYFSHEEQPLSAEQYGGIVTHVMALRDRFGNLLKRADMDDPKAAMAAQGPASRKPAPILHLNRLYGGFVLRGYQTTSPLSIARLRPF